MRIELMRVVVFLIIYMPCVFWSCASDSIIDFCDGITCSGHGTCLVNELGAYCECEESYQSEGLNCVRSHEGPCDYSNWCWQNPFPSYHSIRGIFGLGEEDVWFVGEKGMVLHWDGLNWWNDWTPSGFGLTDVWGTGPEDMWAVGARGIITHWDGSEWREIPSGEDMALYSIWGVESGEIWAIGRNRICGEMGPPYCIDKSVVLSWNGNNWDLTWEADHHYLNNIWGSGPDKVWITGWITDVNMCEEWGCETSAIILHRDGNSWSYMDVPAANNFIDLWGSDDNNVWVVGSRKEGSGDDTKIEWLILNWDGNSWSEVVTGLDVGIRAIHGTAQDDVWSIGYGEAALHWDGSSWSSVPVDNLAEYNELWGFTPKDYWMGGCCGRLMQWNGAEWVSLFRQVDMGSLSDVWGFATDDIWAVGGLISVAYQEHANTFHFDGRTWTAVENGIEEELRAVWGSASDDVWAVGGDKDGYTGVAIHWDGDYWSCIREDFGYWLQDVEGISKDDVWSVGFRFIDNGLSSKSAVFYFDGQIWSIFDEIEDVSLTGIKVYSEDDLWVSGRQRSSGKPLLSQWNGEDWTTWTWDITGDIEDLWGTSADDLWAFGGEFSVDNDDWHGLLMHFNGQEWERKPISNVGFLLDMWGSNKNNLWISGYSVILHYNGIDWTPVSRGNSDWQGGIWGADPDNIWVVGAGGAILKYQP